MLSGNCRGLGRNGGGSRRSRDSLNGCDHKRGDGRFGHSFRGSRNRRGRRRFDRGRLLSGARVLFAGSLGHARGDRGLDHHGGGRRRDDCRTRGGDSARRRLGDDRAGGRTGGNGRRSRRRGDDGRRGSRLGHNPARFRTGRRGRRRGGGHWNCGGRRASGSGRHGGRAHGQMAQARLLFFLQLGGQNGLERVAGLGYMGEIDFGGNGLRGARRRGTRVAAGARSALKMHANLLRLVLLQRTGVGLAGAQAEFRQNVKNLATLDFHLACEIVDTNLTHPPLFKMCYPKPVRRPPRRTTSWQWLLLRIPLLPDWP